MPLTRKQVSVNCEMEVNWMTQSDKLNSWRNTEIRIFEFFGFAIFGLGFPQNGNYQNPRLQNPGFELADKIHVEQSRERDLLTLRKPSPRTSQRGWGEGGSGGISTGHLPLRGREG